ncbi:MAG: hypothetical protein ACREE4_20970 [Stellaceae bacterium]
MTISKATNIHREETGWFGSLPPGWKSARDPMGVQHELCEDTREKLLREIRNAIRCDCADCVAALKRHT